MNIDFQDQVANKTNEGLLHIYINADEYQEEFIKVVAEELTKRNINIENLQQENDKKTKFTQEQFEKGREGNQFFIILFFISALLGGLLGIIAGYTYNQSKHTNNSGISYYMYNKHTRNLGRIMMIIGAFALLLTLEWKFS